MIDNIVSPFGVAKYPKLSEPDTRFKEDGEYSVKLLLDPNDQATQNFTASLDDLFSRNLAFHQAQRDQEMRQKGKDPAKAKKIEGATKGWRDDADPDTGELTGSIEVSAKLAAVGRSQKTGKTWENRPVVIDSSKQVIHVDVGGGSVIRFSAQAYGWFTPQLGAGVSLRLKTVQVKELKTWGGDPVEGFDVVEDGFVGQPSTATVTTAEGQTAGDTSFDF